MVIFKSPHPTVDVPEDVTIWEWLFESENFLELSRQKSVKAFIDALTGERLDYEEVKAKSIALSTAWVRKYGLDSGDTISIVSQNSIWFPVCCLAAFRVGARFNGMSPALTTEEIAYHMKTAKAKFVITTPAALPKVQEAMRALGIPLRNVFTIREQVAGMSSINDLIRGGEALDTVPPYRIPTGTSNKQLCGNLLFSSGTTGLPKAVMSSHHSVISQCMLGQALQPHQRSKMGMLPMYHVLGTWQFILFPIFLNVDIAVLPGFTLRTMLQALVDYQIEEVNTVPPILLKMARDPIVDEYDLSHLKVIMCGAAPLSAEVLEDLEKRFPQCGFRQAYGSTEAGIVSAVPQTHYAYKYANTVGMLHPNTMCKVIDPFSGKELGPDEAGELLFKGPQASMGYLDNEAANKESFDAEGWFHSGDLGYFDAEGFLRITDRLKELIKVKGLQVAPAELENCLLGNHLVADCAVIGIPDEYAGELPKAYIVLKGKQMGDNIDAAEALFNHVQKQKANFKWLAEIEFIDAIPKSPTGKILRKDLRAADKATRAQYSGTVVMANQSSLRFKRTARKKEPVVSVTTVGWLPNLGKEGVVVA